MVKLPVRIIIHYLLPDLAHHFFGIELFPVQTKCLYPEFHIPFIAVYMNIQINNLFYIRDCKLYAYVLHDMYPLFVFRYFENRYSLKNCHTGF